MPHVRSFFTCCLTAFLFHSTLFAKEGFPLHQAQYSLKKGAFTIGTLHRSLAKKNGRYVYQSTAKTQGLFALFSQYKIQEVSTWTVENGQIISQSFVYKSGSPKRPKESTIRFNLPKHRVNGVDKGRTWQLELTDNQPIYDRANYQMALMQDVRNNAPELRYRFIKQGKIKDYHFKRLGPESIQTAAGRFDTIKLARIDNKRSTIIWLAPSLEYLPVKIQQTEEDGGKYQLTLSNLTLH